ncbi:MAG: VanW family protein, partial [Rubrobacteridae bacterium]|nr:VanW family protein [Rubrobacteridae bacterium]
MDQNSMNSESVSGNNCGIVNCNTNKKKKTPLTYATYIILAMVGLIAVIIIGDAAINTNKVRVGVEIVGIDAGGKTKGELSKDLDALETKILKNDLVLVHPKKNWNLDAKSFGMRIDKTATINEAMSYGHTGSAIKRLKTRINLWFKPVKVKPTLSFSKNDFDSLIAEIDKKEEKVPEDLSFSKRDFDSLIAEIDKTVEKVPEDAAIKIVDGRAVSTNSKDGLAVNKSVLYSTLRDAIIAGDKSVDLPVIVVKPDITEADLETTLSDVKQMVKEPMLLRFGADEWKISTDELTDWIEFEKVRQGDRWNLNATFEKDMLTTFIEQSTKKLVTEPKDAEFKIVGDKVAITPSVSGSKVDYEKAYNDVLSICEQDAVREVLLETTTCEPKLTTEDANQMGIIEKVSSFSTTFNAGQTSRVHNIRTLAAALDGNLLAPGQVFSFNGAIGPRTAAKGYREAPAIVNGELVPSLGGGVCQVATTLFNTIFFGGFEVVERHNHSFFISHYPTGRDATVSWGGPDLKFKNDSDSYVLIKTVTTKGSITISFYGTKRNLKVDYKTAGPSNYRPTTIKTVNDPGLPKGTRKIVDKGFSGRDVTVYRTVTVDGEVYKK